MKVLRRPCPLCGCPRGEVLHRLELVAVDEIAAESEIDVVACEACGFGFSDVAATQSGTDRTYEAHSKYADPALFAVPDAVEPPPPVPPWDDERLRARAHELAALVPDRASRILDVGCATGTFLGHLRSLGFRRLVGLDPSPEATRIARLHHGVDAVAGSFSALPPDAGPFDVIAIQHVLEHLIDVRAALDALPGSLAEGGYVYVEVPDARRYADYLVAPYHDLNTEHVNHYSAALLDRAMSRVGLVAERLEQGEIGCSARDRYPVVRGLWRKGARSASDAGGRDEALVAALRRYVAESADLMAAFDAHLRTELAGSERILVWGAGQLAMKLMHDTVLRDKEIVAVVDGSIQKQGMHLSGRRICSPEDAARLPGAAGVPVVVTSVHNQEAILAALGRIAGWASRVVTLPCRSERVTVPQPS